MNCKPGYRLAFHKATVWVEDTSRLPATGFSIAARTQWPLLLEHVPPPPSFSSFIVLTCILFPYSGLFEYSQSNKRCFQDTGANSI